MRCQSSGQKFQFVNAFATEKVMQAAAANRVPTVFIAENAFIQIGMVSIFFFYINNIRQLITGMERPDADKIPPSSSGWGKRIRYSIVYMRAIRRNLYNDFRRANQLTTLIVQELPGDCE
jgi:hypothetical protein